VLRHRLEQVFRLSKGKPRVGTYVLVSEKFLMMDKSQFCSKRPDGCCGPECRSPWRLRRRQSPGGGLKASRRFHLRSGEAAMM
jgi:hypothetical protein